jgi:hypothetical protein
MVGRLHFAAETLPAVPGYWLRGAMVFEKTLPTAGLAEYTLTCTKTVSAGKSSTSEEIWSHADAVPLSVGSAQMPVYIALPADAPQSSKEDDSVSTYAWSLSITLPGNSASTDFDIPVFLTKGPAASKPAEVATILAESVEDLPESLEAQKIFLHLDDAGLPHSIVCGRRNPLPFTICAALFTGAFLAFGYSQAPNTFGMLWAFFNVALWLFIAWAWLYKRMVQLSANRLSIQNNLASMTWVKEFTKSEISHFFYDTISSTNNVAHYRVRLTATSGKKATLAHGINGENLATALVKQLEQWLKTTDQQGMKTTQD